MSWTTAALAPSMRATAENFLYTWNGDWTSETKRKSLSYRSPQCQHIMRPASLNAPTRSNEEWGKYFTHVEGKVTDANIVICDYLADLSSRRAAVHATMTATVEGVGPWSNEYMWILDFDETGEKITRIKEMLDSAATLELRAARINAGER